MTSIIESIGNTPLIEVKRLAGPRQARVPAKLDQIEGVGPGHVVVTLLCDSGLKYLSTDLWRHESG